MNANEPRLRRLRFPSTEDDFGDSWDTEEGLKGRPISFNAIPYESVEMMKSESVSPAISMLSWIASPIRDERHLLAEGLSLSKLA